MKAKKEIGHFSRILNMSARIWIEKGILIKYFDSLFKNQFEV